jgi:lipopolysaccharide export system protein LptA
MRGIKLIFSLAVLLSYLSASGQSDWKSGADNMYGDGVNNVMEGNVYFIKSGVKITCDRAVQFPNKRVLATGNLVINRDGSKLYGSEMDFDKPNDLAIITSNTGIVRIVTKDGVVLKAPVVNYRLNKGEMSFSGGGVIESDDAIIEGEFGFYDDNSGKANLTKDVQVHHPDYLAIADSVVYDKNAKKVTVLGKSVFWHKDGMLTCKKGTYHEPSKTFTLFSNSYALSKDNQVWADSIVYHKKKELLYLGHNICLLDTANHGALLGDYGFVDRNREYAFMTKKAAAVTFQPKEDSLFLRADTLKVYNIHNRKVTTKDSLIRFAKALHHVRFFRTDIQGVCDSLVYTTKDSVMYMHGVPLIWNEQNQISADSISIFSKNQKVDRAEMVLNSFIAQKETDKYFNQIKGRSMIAYFKDNKISRVDVKGNGQTVYFVKDSTVIKGVNLATSSGIGINLSEGKVENMVFRVKPESNMFPLEKVEESQLKLKGFKWAPDNRPLTRMDITQKQVRKSIAKEVEAIPRPTYPIYHRINGKKLSNEIKK